jgi:hypothetical protein
MVRLSLIRHFQVQLLSSRHHREFTTGATLLFFRSEKKTVRMTRGVRENLGSFYFIFGAALPSSLQDSAWSPVGFQHVSLSGRPWQSPTIAAVEITFGQTPPFRPHLEEAHGHTSCCLGLSLESESQGKGGMASTEA